MTLGEEPTALPHESSRSKVHVFGMDKTIHTTPGKLSLFPLSPAQVRAILARRSGS